MTRYANNLMTNSEMLITAFGLSKPEKKWGDNKPRIFPYGVEGEKLYKEFQVLLDTYEHYNEFVSKYKDLIKSLEWNIKSLHLDLSYLSMNGDPNFERPDLQSTTDLLSNVAHKLYYLRSNARTWRREINQLTHDE